MSGQGILHVPIAVYKEAFLRLIKLQYKKNLTRIFDLTPQPHAICRQGEEEHYLDYFTNQGYQLGADTTTHFEGGGDCVFSSPNRMWAGFGERSSKDVYDKIVPFFDADTSYEPIDLIPCEMTGDVYYHLDTCFLPLNDKQALYYPEAFSKESIKLMSSKIELIPVTHEEASKFACNGVSVQQSKTVILPKGCDDTQMLLEKRDWKVKQVDLSEFMKGGGAVQCLILRIIE